MSTETCSEPTPDWVARGSICIKPLAPGLDIHAGGHVWAHPLAAPAVLRGHVDDPAALLSFGSSTYHMPEDCHPGCFSYRAPAGEVSQCP